ncbi:MAG: ribonuclease [Bacteroidota bacterium]
MESQLIIPIVTGIVSVIAGLLLGRIFGKNSKAKIEEAETKAAQILEDANLKSENLKKERLLEAKEKFVQLKAEHDKEILEKNRKINDAENRSKQKEQSINQKTEQLDKQIKENESIKDHLNRQIEVVNQKRTELEKHQEEHIRKLEKIAGLSAEDAKAQLIESLKQEAQTRALSLQQEIIEEARQKANKEARKIVIQSIQRTAAEQTIENTVTVFQLESDEIKGQIIGREGRNIRAIEAATGVDLVVDDTPEAIILSSFDPLRREIARLSLQRLVSDGRIHPARIEEVVEKTRKQLEEQVVEIGERTIWIDCDVLDADGGTRTASINGAFVALVDALNILKKKDETGLVRPVSEILKDSVAAISIGIVDGNVLLDLCYQEDAAAEVDSNLVMTGKGSFIEVQGSGEESTFDQKQLDQMLKLGKQGIQEICSLQKKALSANWPLD